MSQLHSSLGPAHPDIDCAGLRSVVANATGMVATSVTDESGGCGFSLARSGAQLGADSLVVIRREPDPSIVERLGGAVPSTGGRGPGRPCRLGAAVRRPLRPQGSSRLLRPDIQRASGDGQSSGGHPDDEGAAGPGLRFTPRVPPWISRCSNRRWSARAWPRGRHGEPFLRRSVARVFHLADEAAAGGLPRRTDR